MTTALGPVLGGWLIEHASWRWVFLINVFLAAVVISISIWRIPESRAATRANVDWQGALVATVGLGWLVYGLIESENQGWGHPAVRTSLIAGLILLGFFVPIEARQQSPMVPLALFKSGLPDLLHQIHC
jgi:MFS family permease